MGTIAARDCLRVLELTEQVAAAIADHGAPGRLVALSTRMRVQAASRRWRRCSMR